MPSAPPRLFGVWCCAAVQSPLVAGRCNLPPHGTNSRSSSRWAEKPPSISVCSAGLQRYNLVAEKLDPLHARLELNDAELKKIVLRLPAVLGLNHDSLVTKLRLQQECLGMTDVEFRDAVLVEASALGAGYIEGKWALVMSEFAEEEGDQKLQALRSRGLRGLAVGLPRLKRRLADLKEALGSAPKASVWFKSLVKNTDAQWASRRQNLLLNPESGNRDIPSSHSS